MTRLLLVHQEPTEGQFIADHLRQRAGAEVIFSLTASQGARMIADRRFDLALIDAIFPGSPGRGIQLAALAANQNTPVLLLSEKAATSVQLKHLGYSFLEKPFDLEVLVSESQRIMRDDRSIGGRLAAAIGNKQPDLSALTAEIAEAHRLFDLAVTRLGYKAN